MQTYTERHRRKLRFALAGAALAAVAAFSLAGCGATQQASGESASGDDKTITVAAVPTPQGEILENAVASLLEADGYTLEVKEFTDYVQPNTVTEEGDVDANYFQHQPYLDNFNQEQGTHLVSVAKVHFEPMGIYPGKTKSLDALADGATVAVPNDATNEARALLLLAKAGLIEVTIFCCLSRPFGDGYSSLSICFHLPHMLFYPLHLVHQSPDLEVHHILRHLWE